MCCQKFGKPVSVSLELICPVYHLGLPTLSDFKGLRCWKEQNYWFCAGADNGLKKTLGAVVEACAQPLDYHIAREKEELVDQKSKESLLSQRFELW